MYYKDSSKIIKLEKIRKARKDRKFRKSHHKAYGAATI